MAIVRSLTAEKIYAIEAATVVDAEIRGDNLVLITHDGTEIDCGSIRGPAGASGDHNTLINLNLDNHPQYLLVNGTRPMTGPLLLNADPTLALGAATRQYVHGRGASMLVGTSVPSNSAGQTRLVYQTNSFIGWGGVVRSTDCITVPVAGWYKFSFSGWFTSNATGTIRILSIGTDTDPSGGSSDSGGSGLLGDMTIAAHTANPVISTTGFGAVLSASGVGYVSAANTKVAMWARQDSGVSLVAMARFSIELIRTS